MDRDSRTACLPSVVLTMRAISSFFIISTTCGRPSRTLLTRRQTIPASSSTLAVPPVAAISKPRAMSIWASCTAAGLSRSRTLTKPRPRGGLGLRIGLTEGIAGPHDLARGFHLRPEDGIGLGELDEREHRFLDREILGNALGGLPLLGEGLAGHHARGHLGERNAGRLGYERHRPRGARVHFQDIDDAALDRKLDVH